MNDDIWFGAIVTFDCPFCKQRSVEKTARNSDDPYPEGDEEGHMCQMCLKIAPPETEIFVNVEAGTFEEFSVAGYQVSRKPN